MRPLPLSLLFQNIAMWKRSSLIIGNNLWYRNTRILQHNVFKITSSSLYHPKGHGFIERQIQTIKKILIKCEVDGTSPYMVILELMVTPLDDNTSSTAELLANRRNKTTLPAVTRASYNSEAVR